MPRFLIPFLLLCLTALPLAGCGINTVPRLEEEVNAAWAEVQNQYQRRADLVPNLVETVKGYAAHEQATLTQVIEARAKATATALPAERLSDPAALARFEAGQGALNHALSRLMAVAERYPDLKANQHFITLQSQLEGTENRITVARRDYIQAVQRHNTYIRSFPGRLWAMVYGATPKPGFTAPEGAGSPPAVRF